MLEQKDKYEPIGPNGLFFIAVLQCNNLHSEFLSIRKHKKNLDGFDMQKVKGMGLLCGFQ